MRVELERFGYTPMGTFGRLYIPEFECYTIELPWKDNRPRVSCIPEGMYRMTLGRYNRGGYPAYELTDVPGRSLIKVHIGNTVHDLMGCIAPGTELGYIRGVWAVTNSGKAFKEFMRLMDQAQYAELRITRYVPA